MNNVYLFLYNFIWTVIIILSLPLIQILKNRRFAERLDPIFPHPPPRKGSIWIHALSVGEVVSSIPLVKTLKQKYPTKDIVFSVTTPQGIKIAKHDLGGLVEILLPMPFDFWWSVKKIVKYIKPSIFILVETDIWPGLILLLKNRGFKTILINGRISPRTFRSYKRFSFFVRRVFSGIELCIMQSHLDSSRLLDIGIPASKVITSGNIKFDRAWHPMDEKEYKHWTNILNMGREDIVWVAGSIHRGEDEIILECLKRLLPEFSELRLIIAPRRVEWTEDILRLSRLKGLRAARRTELHESREPYDVLILDTVGELGRIYGLGTITFVGGSLLPIGGHNLLEPASFGRPVLFGLHTHNFVLMARLLIEAGGGKRVTDTEDLIRTMRELLSDQERSGGMGKRAKKFVEMNRGALGSIMEHIGSYIEPA